VARDRARLCRLLRRRDSDWTAAFLAGTMIMLVLPPAILGFAGYTIYKATKRQEARQAAASAAATK
jgi:hypothetical protein